MENDLLDKLWNAQDNDATISDANNIVKQAKKQRKSQYIGIAIMAITVVVLVIYALMYMFDSWNNFNLGLLLMIGSLVFRILLEFGSIYRKESKLITMDSKSYYEYLKKYYKSRLAINYVITPICFALYSYGFYLLLPYFKREFSDGWYTYFLISGFVSIAVLMVIVLRSILKEMNFLKYLQKDKLNS